MNRLWFSSFPVDDPVRRAEAALDVLHGAEGHDGIGEAELDARHQPPRAGEALGVGHADVDEAGVVLVEPHPEQRDDLERVGGGGLARRRGERDHDRDAVADAGADPVGELGADRHTSDVDGGLAGRARRQRARRGGGQVLDAPGDEGVAQIVRAVLKVDPLEVGADAPDHHLARREHEARHPHHARHAAQPVLDLADLGSVDLAVAVRLHDEVGVEGQHLVLELALEAARDRHDDDQRRHAEDDAHRRHRREHGEQPQQEGDHGHQSPRQNHHHGDRLEDAGARVRDGQQGEPRHQERDPASEQGVRAARPPHPVQIPEADEAFEPEGEELAQSPKQPDREGRRQAPEAVGRPEGSAASRRQQGAAERETRHRRELHVGPTLADC